MRLFSVILFLIPLALLLAALQATLAGRFHLLGGQPHILLIALVLLVMVAGRQAALLPALIAAPILDSLAGLPLGASVAPMLVVVYLAGLGERTLFSVRFTWPVFITFVATLAADAILLVELTLLGHDIAWADALLRISAPGAALNALIVFALYLPLESWRTSRASL